MYKSDGGGGGGLGNLIYGIDKYVPPGDIMFLIVFHPYIGYLNRSAFSLRSMAVLVGRANKPRWGKVGERLK